MELHIFVLAIESVENFLFIEFIDQIHSNFNERFLTKFIQTFVPYL